MNRNMTSPFERAHAAWEAMAPLRRSRTRLKNFTYGDQWSWPVADASGHIITEGDAVRSLGKTPLTNNLLRSLVKSVVGRFRYNIAAEKRKESAAPAFNRLDELDARTLEEFLISGCAIQRVVAEKRPEGCGAWADKVSPALFFCNPFTDPRGTDIELIGMLHEMDCEQMIMRFGHGNARRARMIRDTWRRNCRDDDSSTAFSHHPGTFFSASADGKCRVIEVWTLDYTGNRRSASSSTSYKVEWHCRYYAPCGMLLDHTVSPYADGSHPFVVKFYPLTDGEVHPFIEDIVEQQRHINRLITMIDHVLAVSAKGVLLYPLEAQPDGFSIADAVALWNRPGGVIPIDGTAGRIPTQLNSEASTDNAARLLDIEMNMMRQISGVSAALQGQTSAANQSATMFESQIQNSAIALLDIFETFNTFRTVRDEKLAQCAGICKINSN
ncbi:MAG: hypothetical protein K2K68_01955 [Duncaniella sp.]|nr:hypothetical protein [Duncaniella sp.]